MGALQHLPSVWWPGPGAVQRDHPGLGGKGLCCSGGKAGVKVNPFLGAASQVWTWMDLRVIQALPNELATAEEGAVLMLLVLCRKSLRYL